MAGGAVLASLMEHNRLVIGLAFSNSFLTPTHQPNAPTMGSACCGVPDFLPAGSVMILQFLVAMLFTPTLLY